STPRGSSLRKISVYMRPLGWTHRTFIGETSPRGLGGYKTWSVRVEQDPNLASAERPGGLLRKLVDRGAEGVQSLQRGGRELEAAGTAHARGGAGAEHARLELPDVVVLASGVVRERERGARVVDALEREVEQARGLDQVALLLVAL